MGGLRGRGSELRVKLSDNVYHKVPGCQDIVVNFPQAGTIDSSDQDTPVGQIEILPGDVQEGTAETTVNYDVGEPTHRFLEDKINQSIDAQVKIAGPGNTRWTFTGAVVRTFSVTLSKAGLQTASVSLGVGLWVREADA